ncbi:putative lipoprotein [Treponema primitia ZAS-2]|uniref:Putative lipoprotein n=1 Tax=Treponema primitia (strain ATCC BAA-887 / DSM 12427 / ZAS-2) TaxID=545694 RepID=F5YH30_TREPZ|nr:hypothetical protein [Treponema primitia]AEF84690.1 putative lipoprotein [Treponema primitia ZAS-2]
MKKAYGVMVLAVLAGISIVFAGCSKKETANAGSQPSNVIQEVKAESKDTTFGKYPADYKIAYFSLLGSSLNPTVRNLFSPGTTFATSLEGIPTTITLEKTTASEKEFTGQLLVTLHVPEKDDMKMMRLLVTFVSDDMSEMSYCRYVNLVNLISGSKTEKKSTGSQNSDGETLGFFVGVMEYFWDMSKLNG